MFQGYSQETVDFMWGIRFNNERGWFLALSLLHLSEPTRLLSISYAVFCLKKKKTHNT